MGTPMDHMDPAISSFLHDDSNNSDITAIIAIIVILLVVVIVIIVIIVCFSIGFGDQFDPNFQKKTMPYPWIGPPRRYHDHQRFFQVMTSTNLCSCGVYPQ